MWNSRRAASVEIASARFVLPSVDRVEHRPQTENQQQGGHEQVSIGLGQKRHGDRQGGDQNQPR